MRSRHRKALRRNASTPAESHRAPPQKAHEDIPALDGSNLAPYGPVARRTLTANEAKVAMEVFVANATDQSPKRRSEGGGHVKKSVDPPGRAMTAMACCERVAWAELLSRMDHLSLRCAVLGLACGSLKSGAWLSLATEQRLFRRIGTP